MTQTMVEERMFVTAEDTQNVRTRDRRSVWVVLETLAIIVDGAPLTVMFVVTTSTGYRAELRACTFDGHPAGFVNCTRELGKNGQHGMSVDKWCEHTRTHCHNFHLPLAEKFRDDVMKTYRQR